MNEEGIFGYMEAQAHKLWNWDRYFMDICEVVKTRSTCSRRQVAAVIVNKRSIVSTGYNGTPHGIKNCNEGGCPRCSSEAKSGDSLTKCYCSHAEENAIVQAARYGTRIDGCTLYNLYSPCILCTKMILNSGINRVVYKEEYTDYEEVAKLFKEAQITLVKVKDD